PHHGGVEVIVVGDAVHQQLHAVGVRNGDIAVVDVEGHARSCGGDPVVVHRADLVAVLLIGGALDGQLTGADLHVAEDVFSVDGGENRLDPALIQFAGVNGHAVLGADRGGGHVDVVGGDHLVGAV